MPITEVSGVVTDEDDNPVAADVYLVDVQNLTPTTSSGVDGTYSIVDPGDNSVIPASNELFAICHYGTGERPLAHGPIQPATPTLGNWEWPTMVEHNQWKKQYLDEAGETGDGANISFDTMGADLTGAYKWRGGVIGPDGKIYCVPSSANDILIIDPVAGTAVRSDMGRSLSGTDKYNGGVLAPNGKIYCVPKEDREVLVIDPLGGVAYFVDTSVYLHAGWAAPILGPDGKIYALPISGDDLLVIDPVTEDVTRVDTGLSLDGSFRGSFLGSDGKIYGIPYSNEQGILIIDTATSSYAVHHFHLSLDEDRKWRDCVPNPYSEAIAGPGADNYHKVPLEILDLNKTIGVITFWNSPSFYIEDYGYYSAVLGPDKKIYCLPYNEDNIAVIDLVTKTITQEYAHSNFSGSRLYYSGVLHTNGKIYGIPYSAETILILDPDSTALSERMVMDQRVNKY
jgi:hypothetical protein